MMSKRQKATLLKALIGLGSYIIDRSNKATLGQLHKV